MTTELGYINTVVLTSPALNSTAAKCYLMSTTACSPLILKKRIIANSVELDQTAPLGSVRSGSALLNKHAENSS